MAPLFGAHKEENRHVEIGQRTFTRRPPSGPEIAFLRDKTNIKGSTMLFYIQSPTAFGVQSDHNLIKPFPILMLWSSIKYEFTKQINH